MLEIASAEIWVFGGVHSFTENRRFVLHSWRWLGDCSLVHIDSVWYCGIETGFGIWSRLILTNEACNTQLRGLTPPAAKLSALNSCILGVAVARLV